MKKVLDVGQCQMDHGSIRRLIEGNFDARVAQAHDAADALVQLGSGAFDLVLVNRQLDANGDDGLEIIKAIKSDPRWSSIPVMLVTNYPEYQQQAVAAGAEVGFGKNALGRAETSERLRKFLG